MKNQIRNFSLGLLSIFTLMTAQVQAEYHYANSDCCDECFDPCGGWSFGADFLYWKACRGNLLYGTSNVQVDSNTTAVTDHYVDMGWNPGFRLRLGKENVYCGWDLTVSYTDYYATGHERVELASPIVGLGSTYFFQPLNSLTAIEAKNTLNYQTFDVLMHYECCICQGHLFTPFFGLQGVKIKQGLDARNETAAESQTVSWTSDYKALGLEFGSSYKYAFECGLNFCTKAGVSLVAGNNDVKNIQFTDGVSTDTTQTFRSDSGLCTPGLNLQVLFCYDKCWCDRIFTFHVGYEFQEWWNVAQARRFPSPGNFTTTSASGESLMMHGLVLGMDVGF